MSKIWVDVYCSHVLTTATVLANDLLNGVMDSSELQRATIVAIKGTLSVSSGINSATSTNTLNYAAGLIVAPTNYTTGDFPYLDSSSQGQLASGWMWRTFKFSYGPAGNGTVPLTTADHWERIDVKTKRALKGPGTNTLWWVTDAITAQTNFGSSVFAGAVLLNIA